MTESWAPAKRLISWYKSYERPISSLSLIGGFIFDAITLQRVDVFWDNFWIGLHLLVVAITILLINTRSEKTASGAEEHFWLVNVLQFFFGGLFSAYLVFYFRSGTWSVEWPFLLLLALAFWANESFKKGYVRLGFQLTLFYLSLLVYSIYIMPIVVHAINAWVFLLSGLVSVIIMALFLAVFGTFARKKLSESRHIAFLSIGSVLVIVNILYFTNLIPPIPLSLKDAGTYHTLAKTDTGYDVSAEAWHWQDLFSMSDTFHTATGSPVYVYTAIFSPSNLNTTIIHDWQYFDPQKDDWVDEGSVTLPIVGGREQGFRTYSVRDTVAFGKWKVNVETSRGTIIGVVRFTVAEGNPVLVNETK